MANPFKTQVVPFHIHTDHDGVKLGQDKSTIDIPLDPPLVLPKGSKATVKMYGFAGTNSAVNISPELDNNAFFVTNQKHAALVTKVQKNFVIGIAQTDRNPIPSNQGFTDKLVNITKGSTISQIESTLNSAFGSNVVIRLKVDHAGDGFAIFAKTENGSVSMIPDQSFDDIDLEKTLGSNTLLPGTDINQIVCPFMEHGRVILDASSSDFVQITPDLATFTQFDFKSGASPVAKTIPRGIYAVKGTAALPTAVSDLESALENSIANEIVNIYSSEYDGSDAGSDETYNSINISTDGVHFTVTLRLSNGAYTLTVLPGLARFLGIEPGTYPPLGTSLLTDYEIPKLPGVTPRTDDFSTLQLRSGISTALGGQGKPAAIISQFTVPSGTVIGGNFEVIPPVPMEVPCTLPSPVSSLRFQLTSMRGDAADMQGNHWSASLLLTIYER